MYRLMRNVHLVLGLGVALALAVYLLSSVRLARRTWFKTSPTVTEGAFSVDPAQSETPRALGLHLMERHGLRGDLARIDESEEGEFSLVIRRPGTNYRVRYHPGAAEARVQTNQLAFIGALMGLHFTYGFWHGDGMINVWSAIVLLTSIVLFVIGGTGIYLWFKTHEERAVGSVLLAAGLGFAITLMVLVRIQG